jgi:hypothetical protein
MEAEPQLLELAMPDPAQELVMQELLLVLVFLAAPMVILRPILQHCSKPQPQAYQPLPGQLQYHGLLSRLTLKCRDH